MALTCLGSCGRSLEKNMGYLWGATRKKAHFASLIATFKRYRKTEGYPKALPEMFGS